MEKSVIDRKDENKYIYDEGKQAEYPDNTPPNGIEQIVGDMNDDNNEDNDE